MGACDYKGQGGYELLSKSLADLGGRHHQREPHQQDPILLFLYTFLPKSAHIGGWHPPNGSARPPPPMGNPGSATV